MGVYVQICPICRTENFTDSPDNPVARCKYCKKMRIGQVIPVPYDPDHEEGAEETGASGADGGQAAGEDAGQAAGTGEGRASGQAGASGAGSSEADSAGAGAAPGAIGSDWQALLQGIDGAGSGAAGAGSDTAAAASTGGVAAPAQSPQDKKSAGPIRLTSVGRYQGLSEVFRPEDSPVLLGRYAGDALDEGDPRAAQYARCEAFFQQDTRVSSYHCHLIWRDGVWYVRDGVWAMPDKGIPEKPSTNTTRVGGRIVSGDVPVKTGDVLQLGKDADSPRLILEIQD